MLENRGALVEEMYAAGDCGRFTSMSNAQRAGPINPDDLAAIDMHVHAMTFDREDSTFGQSISKYFWRGYDRQRLRRLRWFSTPIRS